MSCIEINMVCFQQSLEFFLERMLAMMLFLIANVSPHAFDLRLADGESAESRLPTKSSCGLPLRPTR